MFRSIVNARYAASLQNMLYGLWIRKTESNEHEIVSFEKGYKSTRYIIWNQNTITNEDTGKWDINAHNVGIPEDKNEEKCYLITFTNTHFNGNYYDCKLPLRYSISEDGLTFSNNQLVQMLGKYYDHGHYIRQLRLMIAYKHIAFEIPKDFKKFLLDYGHMF